MRAAPRRSCGRPTAETSRSRRRASSTLSRPTTRIFAGSRPPCRLIRSRGSRPGRCRSRVRNGVTGVTMLPDDGEVLMARYAYGDSDLAAERLALVATVFEPTSREFVQAAAPRSPALAVDLGCGPGHTTRLLHEATGAARTLGLDASAS